MGILDLRIASLALDCAKRALPESIPKDSTREISRLAIAPAHRWKNQIAMLGLLREVLVYSKANGISLLLSASIPTLFEVYRRYNPSAKLIDCEILQTEDPVLTHYFEPIRAYGGIGIVYTLK